MPDLYNNKAVLGDGTVIMDLTQDTVTADKLASGYTAHDMSGAPITGTNTNDVDSSTATAAVAAQVKSATPSFSAQTITPDAEYDYLSQVKVICTPAALCAVYPAAKAASVTVSAVRSMSVSPAAGTRRHGDTRQGIGIQKECYPVRFFECSPRQILRSM